MRLVGEARRRLQRPRGDAGVTLVEQVVAMSIFMLVAALFMSLVVSMTTSASRTQNRTQAADQVRAAFLKMDRQVRYASSVNLPGRGASGDWYVEFRSPQLRDPARATPNADLCTQWRYDVTGGSLTMRSWSEGTPPGTDWSPVAVVSKAPTTAPFVVTRATDTAPYQQLSVDLSAASGSGTTAGSAGLRTTFVARNSSPSSPSNADADANGVSDTPVCPLGVRQ